MPILRKKSGKLPRRPRILLKQRFFSLRTIESINVSLLIIGDFRNVQQNCGLWTACQPSTTEIRDENMVVFITKVNQQPKYDRRNG